MLAPGWDTTDTSTTAAGRRRVFTTLVLVVAGALMVAAGIWGLVAPRSFAAFAGFPYSRHFLHDAGAFQLGIGVTLLAAAAWVDAAAVVLAGFLVTNTVHTVNHVVDLDAGGHRRDAWRLGLLSVLTLAALVVRMRQLGWVAGEVTTTAAAPALARFVRQKTVLLTSYRRDGEHRGRRRPRVRAQPRERRQDQTDPAQPDGGDRPVHRARQTHRTSRPDAGTTCPGRRVPPRRPVARPQVPDAAGSVRPAGAPAGPGQVRPYRAPAAHRGRHPCHPGHRTCRTGHAVGSVAARAPGRRRSIGVSRTAAVVAAAGSRRPGR